MKSKYSKKSSWKKGIVAAGLLLAVVVSGAYVFFQLAGPSIVSADGIKVEDPWAVKIGEDEMFLVASEEEGQAVIEGVKNYYSSDGTTKSAVKISPEMTLEKKDLKWTDDTEPVMKNEEAVAQIVVKNRVSDPIVSVTTTDQVAKTEEINYKTKYKQSKELVQGEVKVLAPGKKGKKVVTSEITKVNGKVLSDKVIAVSVEQKPEDRVIEKGIADNQAAAQDATAEITTAVKQPTTGATQAASTEPTSATAKATEAANTAASTEKSSSKESAASTAESNSKETSKASTEKTTSKTAKGSGEAVVAYALKFVGNPYVYGGTSLTKGTDCSGFTKSVYAKFGIKLPRTSKAQRSAGRGVSYSEAKPGDLICYSGHVALYMGNGKIVHASTPSSGIKVSTATYKKILTVRRIIE